MAFFTRFRSLLATQAEADRKWAEERAKERPEDRPGYSKVTSFDIGELPEFIGGAGLALGAVAVVYVVTLLI